MRRCRPLIERIREKLVEEDRGYETPCLIFTGALDGRGYGHIRRGRASEGFVKVHRAVWEHERGPIPDGLTVDHLCEQHDCCRTEHEKLETNYDNWRRGRGPAVLLAQAHRNRDLARARRGEAVSAAMN